MWEVRAFWKGWLAGLGFAIAGAAYGAVNIAPGLPVSQNFDSIGSSDITTLPSGWKVDKLTSVRTAGRYDAAGDQTERGGTIGPNGIYNFGSPSASGADRSVGFLSSSSATKSGNLYVQLVNAGAAAIPSLDVSYNVEKYRNGSNPAGFRVQLFFSLDGVNWTSAGEDFFTGFSPDGNIDTFPVAPGETEAVSATLDLSAAPLAAGSSLYLAWNYSVATGTTTSYAQALGVDDVSVMVTGSEGFNVYFDQVEGFVVLEGIPETLMALAGGGTEPYAYSWSSTLGGTHYETTNNLLTIRGSAPADYYTATVVATDSSEPPESVTNTIGFTVSGDPDILLDFEEGTLPVDYTPVAVGMSGYQWYVMNIAHGSDPDDRKFGSFSARFRHQTGNPGTLYNFDALVRPVRKLKFWYGNHGTDSGGTFKVQVSSNRSIWTDIGAAHYAPAGTNLAQATIDSIPAGMIHVQFITTAGDGQRVNIDEIGVFFDPPGFEVVFDQPNGFEVEAGSSGSVTATAANGNPPYVYVWTSTLDTAHFTATGNQFTILTSAPAGMYSASVTATDSSDPVQTATHSLAFQISSRHPIDLTPPVNGSVDTDPSGSALAGETVTVLAVPAGGYVVDVVSVTGDDSTPVEVTDGTFTMPDQPVTVTVTFMISNEPDILLDFEGTVLPTSYAAAVGEMAGYDWNLINVIRGTLENDRKNGEVSARIRHETATAGTLVNAVPFAQAITRIRFWYANYGTDSTVTFKVQVSANGVDWSDVGEEAYSADGIELAEAEIAAIPPGMTFVRFITTGGANGDRINLEDVGLFLGGEAFLAVTLDKLDGFEVVEGYSETITATALNGTGPYVFSWSTTMAEGDCAAEGPVFTIHSHAARGDYSATVEVTDSTSAAASQTVHFAVVEPPQPEGIADFRFNEPPYLRVTARDSGLVVSDMDLTSGTIETNVTTGTYFPDEPFIEESGGWAADNQAGAKAFFFTITPAEGWPVTVEGISFRAYATSAGPSAFGYDIGGGLATGEVDAPSAILVVVSQAVAGVVGRTEPIEVKIQGWANGSRETSGTGTFRLDDVVIHGRVSGDAPEPPPIVAITVLAGTGFLFNVPGEFDLLRVEGAGTATLPGGEFDWQVLTSGEGHDYTVSEGTVTILSGAADARMVRIVLTPL